MTTEEQAAAALAEHEADEERRREREQLRACARLARSWDDAKEAERLDALADVMEDR